MHLISVIMPVYNGERFLAEAIDSILAQTYTDFELLIVDDGSQDSSPEIARSYQERDKRIRVIQLERNMGSADARNQGIAEANGDFIATMDCDDVSLPERFQKQVDFLQSNPEIGVLGACCRVVNEDKTTELFEFIVPETHALIALNLWIGASFAHSTVMFRRDVLAAVGGYEPGRWAGDDSELFLRLLVKTENMFANLTEILVLYRRHEQAKSFGRNETRDSERRQSRERVLEHLWKEPPQATVDRFQRLFANQKLGWAERRAVKQGIKRLIETMIAENMVESSDKPVLDFAMNRRLEQASPRNWQRFCHWRRHRFNRQ